MKSTASLVFVEKYQHSIQNTKSGNSMNNLTGNKKQIKA